MEMLKSSGFLSCPHEEVWLSELEIVKGRAPELASCRIEKCTKLYQRHIMAHGFVYGGAERNQWGYRAG